MPLAIQSEKESVESAKRVQKVMESLASSYPQLVSTDDQKEFVRRLVVLHDRKDEDQKKSYKRMIMILTAINAIMLSLTVYFTFF